TTGGSLPDLIQLRLPASLLSSFSTNSRLTINPAANGAGNDKLSISVSREAAHKHAKTSEDLFPLKLENQTDTFEWYQRKRSQAVSDNMRKYFRIGETRSRYSINNPKSGVDLKRIGERTRTLLDQERKKRKEIVRLDEDELYPVNSKETAEKGMGERNPTNDNVPMASEKERKTPKTSTLRKRAAASKRKRHDPTVDGWMPNTDHLVSKAVAKDDRSNIVRLHGLPRGIQPDHIRKFFHGLNPSLIFVLPTMNRFIEGWDVSDEFSSMQKQNIAVERHPESFRVYVKFQSVLVADAAMERQGESIGFDRNKEDFIKKDVVGAAISLSPVSRYVASYLQKHLAICTRKGEPIIETLTGVEQRITCVSELAWTVAAKRLKLDSLMSHLRSSNLRCRQLLSNYQFIPKEIPEYDRLVRVYNQIVEAHKKLEVDRSLLLMHTFDPSCSDDSAHRIIQSVSHWFLDEIRNIGNNLRESRLRLRDESHDNFDFDNGHS
ncbi:hypothetical protein HJC23_010859, partial [Cyclotella cryptica]